MKTAPRSLAGLLLPLLLMACSGREEKPPPEAAPRPVEVMVLERLSPNRLDSVAGSVASWKTEEIGFEVEGRVTFVLEAGSEVVGGMKDAEGKLLEQPTLLAQLDTTRYELRRKSLEAQIGKARREREAAVVELEKVIPARRRAAVAQHELSKIEVARNEKLVPTGAGSQRDLDRVRAQAEENLANIVGIDAQKEAKAAEVASIDAGILELQQSLAEAERDLADCSLYSPYRGEVARTQVIPGAFVGRGQHVLTVQMMDPIKIDFEVSAALRRQLSRRSRLPVRVPTDDAAARAVPALLYVIDPVADPNTRTFTVTLLARNEKVSVRPPPGLSTTTTPKAARLWGVLEPGRFGDSHFVEAGAIQEDADGHFLWRVKNRSIKGETATSDIRLEVEKARIKLGKRRVPFLGIWTAVSIEIPEGSKLAPDDTLVAAGVTYPDGQGAGSWKGNVMLLSTERWLLQPGDVVSVGLSDDSVPEGLYVPASSILERLGDHAVFVIDPEKAGVVKRIPVTVGATWRGRRRIEAIAPASLDAGMRLVTSGALFLKDGEAVQVVSEEKAVR